MNNMKKETDGSTAIDTNASEKGMKEEKKIDGLQRF